MQVETTSAPFLQLIEELQNSYHVQFEESLEHSVSGKIRALEESKQKNLELIQSHFDEIIILIQHKKPCIQALAELNGALDQQIAQLKNQQIKSVSKGA